ncbi:MAG: histidinol-phosphatase HisJ family protein [Candidatus Dormiibacterota bacterium]
MTVTPTVPSSITVPGDLHVHSEWSWDAPRGAMEESCRRAIALGLQAVAFTDHADYSALAAGSRLDVAGYLETVAHCQREFPRLAVWSGVELGEPHRFTSEASAVLSQGNFDLVLGSVHSVISNNAVLELSEPDQLATVNPRQMMRAYCEELVQLIEGPVPFEVLTHLEYPKRFWLPQWPPYHSDEYQLEIRAVLEVAAGRGLALELNTSRGGDPARALCPSPEVIGWWREVGGRKLSVGSDAHDPSTVAAGFKLAGEIVAAAGFAPPTARIGLWASS